MFHGTVASRGGGTKELERRTAGQKALLMGHPRRKHGSPSSSSINFEISLAVYNHFWE